MTDAADPLSAMRDRFLIPTAPDGVAGDLPGRPVARAATADRGGGRSRRSSRPGPASAWTPGSTRGTAWFTRDTALRESMGRIVGARPVEVALLNSLTVNLHLLFASFFRPSGRRRRILADGPLFPSDRHALTSHLAQRGLDPATDLVVIGPRDGEHLVADRGPRGGHRRQRDAISPSSSCPASTSRPGRRSTSNG